LVSFFIFFLSLFFFSFCQFTPHRFEGRNTRGESGLIPIAYVERTSNPPALATAVLDHLPPKRLKPSDLEAYATMLPLPLQRMPVAPIDDLYKPALPSLQNGFEMDTVPGAWMKRFHAPTRAIVFENIWSKVVFVG
jgi:hypothetical protein